MVETLYKFYLVCVVACLVFLFGGLCIGLLGVWMEGFYDNSIRQKLIETNWMLFFTALAGAVISIAASHVSARSR